MKKLMTLFILTFKASTILACSLEVPIKLSEIQISPENNHHYESFLRIETDRFLGDFFDNGFPGMYDLDPTLDIALPKTLNESEGRVPAPPKVYGARVQFGDTMWGIGMSDVYQGTQLKRTVERKGKAEVHKVQEVSYEGKVDDESIMIIVDGEIRSIEIVSQKKRLCVTKASR